MNEELEKILVDETFLPELLRFNEFLESSGLLKYLRDIGLSHLNLTPLTAEHYAVSAARGAGWLGCLELITNFKNIIIKPELNKPSTPKPDFGALDIAVAKGTLTKEEADGRKSGSTTEYTTTTRNPDGSYKSVPVGTPNRTIL